MNQIQDWIVRYYASHDDIPAGHHDGEFLQALVRCKDCHFWDEMPSSSYAPYLHRCRWLDIASRAEFFCQQGMKKDDPS